MNKIYKLTDPITNEIRYIGKTKNKLEKRLYEHCTIRNLSKRNNKNNWIKKLISLGLRPIIDLIEIVDNETNWQEREIYWIDFFIKLNCNLTNGTTGGDGGNGAKRSKEYIEKIIEIKRKNGTLTRSAYCRQKISEALKGKPFSEERNKKFQKYSEEKKRKIIQFDINHVIIEEWGGVRICANTLKINHSGIIRCLKGKQDTYKGFIWEYKID